MVLEYVIAMGYYFSLFLLAIVFLYGYHLHKKEKALEERRNTLIDNSSAILERAHKKSEIIIENALEKTKNILNETEVFHSDIEEELKKILKSGIEEYLADIKKEIEKVEQSYIHEIEVEQEQYREDSKKIADVIKQVGAEEVNDFKNSLDKTNFNAEAYLKAKMDAEYDASKKEIELFKQEKMHNIESKVDIAVRYVTEYIIKKSITEEDHERLIYEALDEAKKGGMFEI